MASRIVPPTAQKTAGDLITSALWNVGVVEFSNFITSVPTVRVRQGASQTLTSGSWAALGMNISDIDTDSGHSNSVNNSRYTCQVAGWYYAEGYLATTAGASSRFEASIAKNGTIVGGSATFLIKTNDLQSIVCGTLVQLAVGDYIEVWGRQNSGANVSTFDGSDLAPCMNAFWVHR